MSVPPAVPAPQPIFNLPSVVTAFIAIIVGVHLLRVLVLGPDAEIALILNAAFIPVRLSEPQEAAAFLPALEGAKVWMFVTYAFLHGDAMHLIINAIWMAAFATPVARRFGSVRFVLFTLAGAVGGAAVHYFAHMHDAAPMIGASAALSAHMAASTRFAFEPGGALSGHMRDRDAADRQPAAPLMRMLRNRRAMLFVVVWFAVNLLFGVTVGDVGSGSIAWEAHIGGFLVGLLLFPLFDPIGSVPGEDRPN